jgi:hypothetical protein
VGENYKKDVEFFDKLKQTGYKDKVQAWQEVSGKWKKPQTPTPAPQGKPAPTVSIPSKAPANPQPKKVNFVVLLDTSKSMGRPMDGKSKLDEAKSAIQKFAATLPKENSNFQLRVYGNQGSEKGKDKALSCSSTAKIYEATQVDANKLNAALAQVVPTGYNPLALAIDASKQDMKNGAPISVENQVIVLSDGYENCGGDPVQAAKSLHLSAALANVHVIGLDVSPTDERGLRQVADVTGGEYQDVSKPDQLDQALGERIQSMKMVNEPWQAKALDAIMKEHRFDKQRLNQFHEQLLAKIQQEYERLNEANDFIKEKDKVDSTTYDEIDNWIHERKQQLSDYVDGRYKEIGIQLDRDWQEQANTLLESWSKEDGKKQDIVQKTKQLLQQDLQKKQMEQIQTKQLLQQDLLKKQMEQIQTKWKQTVPDKSQR